MSQMLTKTLIKCLVDVLIALEFLEDEDNINEDQVIQLMEQISDQLQNLTDEDKAILIEEIAQLSKEYSAEVAEFVKNIPENFGINA